jgi:hypothetical protein
MWKWSWIFMPNGRLNLQDRKLVIAVAVLLIAVALFNLRAFIPGFHGLGGTKVALEVGPPVPADLEAMTEVAASRLATASLGTGAGLPGLSASSDLGANSAAARDPFHVGPVRHAAARTSGGHAARETQLTCSAVLLGEGPPTAVINGKAHHPGDWISSYRVLRIGTEGVLLRSGDKHLFLPVGAKAGDSVAYSVATQPTDSADEGLTQMEAARRERP